MKKNKFSSTFAAVIGFLVVSAAAQAGTIHTTDSGVNWSSAIDCTNTLGSGLTGDQGVSNVGSNDHNGGTSYTGNDNGDIPCDTITNIPQGSKVSYNDCNQGHSGNGKGNGSVDCGKVGNQAAVPEPGTNLLMGLGLGALGLLRRKK